MKRRTTTHRARLAAIAPAVLGLAGCLEAEFLMNVVGPLVYKYNEPAYMRTGLPPLSSAEKTMGCPQIDLAIDRADTIRWLIREEPHRGSYVRALSAADVRIRELLQLKREHECPPRTTALPWMNDIALLAALESAQARLDAGGDEGQLLKERTRLLDGLRLVPAPAAVPGVPAEEKKPAATNPFP